MNTVVVLVALAALVIAGFAFVIYFMNQKLGELKNDSALGLIKQDIQGMSQALTQTQQHMNERLDKAATVFGSLQNELGKMQELGRSMKDIQDVLKSPKLRGNIGEQMMTDILKQQIPKASYSLQYSFKSGEKVDAVIRTRNGLIPIDSKFPAENFLKFSQAEDQAEKARLKKEFMADVKKHIQDIAKKYVLPHEGTIDYALMYVPGEAVFYDIISDSDLFEFGAKHRVLLVSPQSFYFYIGTVLRSLEGELIEQKAKEVMNYLKGIQIDSQKFGTELVLVNKHLTNAKNVADQASTSYSKLHGRIEAANQLTGQTVEQIEAATERVTEVSLIGADEE